MLRRPKVQFKPKIGGKEADRKKAPVVKPRSTSTSSVTSSSSHVLAANEREVVSVTPVTRTTIVEVPPSDDETEDQLKSEEQMQEVVEEQVIEYENLHPVQFESQEYNCLVQETVGNRSFDSENIPLPQDFDRQEQVPTETVTTPTLPPSPSKGSRITLKPKETPAALTVSPQDTSVKRKNPVSGNTAPTRKPRICLSSSRVKLPTDRQVTMFDLLSYNPPMTEEQKERKKKAEEECAMSSRKSIDEPVSKDKAPSEKTTTKKSGPRVKMGADGSIIVDEESLILTSNMPDAVGETVYDEAENGANYASFRTKGSKFRWSNEETVKFYRALSAVGPDFTLMSQLFFSGSRTRLDLRNKFKKEEKQNPQLIDRALTNNDLSLLKEVLEKRKEEQTVESNQEIRQAIVPEAENPLPDQEEEVTDGHDAVIIKEAQLQEKSMPDERPGNKSRGKKKKTASQEKEFKSKKKATLVSEPVRKSSRTVKPNVRLSS